MTRELCGLPYVPGVRTLETLLRERERRLAERAWLGQRLWQLGAYLCALGSGQEAGPDYLTLFPPRRLACSAEGVKRRVLAMLDE